MQEHSVRSTSKKNAIQHVLLITIFLLVSTSLLVCTLDPPVESFTIHYELDGGTNGTNPATYTSEDDLITLTDPVKTGYDFIGWYSDAGFTTEASTIPSGSTGNRVFYAKWLVAPFMITYIMDEGVNSVNNPNSFTIEDGTITFIDPVKDGYDFAGWYSDAGFTVPSPTIPEGTLIDQVIYAKWVIETYTITYMLSGGTNGVNPLTYTILDELITLNPPTKSESYFIGWYSDAEYTTESDTILEGSTGTRTFYARWMDYVKLLAADGASLDYFGQYTAINGDYAVISAWGDDDHGDSSGSAYIFHREEDGSWDTGTNISASDGTENDAFGLSVAISEEDVIVGAPWDDANGDTAGSAYIFHRNGDGNWDDGTRIISGDIAAGDEFGYSVGISGDYAVVGAPVYPSGFTPASGSVYLFHRDTAGNWSEQTKLVPDDGAEGDRFGHSVSISGDCLAVGAVRDDTENGVDSGSAYIYDRDLSGTWNLNSNISASDGEGYDYFSTSIAIEGDTLIAGSPLTSDGGYSRGSAYIYRRIGGIWDSEIKLTAHDAVDYDRFGESVSINGNLAVVGAKYDGDHGAGSGSAYIFQQDDSGNWDTGTKITAPDGAAEDYFGASVSLSGNQVLCGSFFDDDNGMDSGSAHIFTFDEVD